MLKKVFTLLLVAFVIMQFFRPEKNFATGDPATANDISVKYAVPEDVKQILKISCNDCHSNNTFYPWYFYVQPVAWWLDDHVREGKKELNFNEFMTYTPRKQFHKLEEIEKEVKENEMPLQSYTIIHHNAKLTPRQKQILIEWSKNLKRKNESYLSTRQPYQEKDIAAAIRFRSSHSHVFQPSDALTTAVYSKFLL